MDDAAYDSTATAVLRYAARRAPAVLLSSTVIAASLSFDTKWDPSLQPQFVARVSSKLFTDYMTVVLVQGALTWARDAIVSIPVVGLENWFTTWIYRLLTWTIWTTWAVLLNLHLTAAGHAVASCIAFTGTSVADAMAGNESAADFIDPYRSRGNIGTAEWVPGCGVNWATDVKAFAPAPLYTSTTMEGRENIAGKAAWALTSWLSPSAPSAPAETAGVWDRIVGTAQDTVYVGLGVSVILIALGLPMSAAVSIGSVVALPLSTPIMKLSKCARVSAIKGLLVAAGLTQADEFFKWRAGAALQACQGFRSFALTSEDAQKATKLVHSTGVICNQSVWAKQLKNMRDPDKPDQEIVVAMQKTALLDYWKGYNAIWESYPAPYPKTLSSTDVKHAMNAETVKTWTGVDEDTVDAHIARVKKGTEKSIADFLSYRKVAGAMEEYEGLGFELRYLRDALTATPALAQSNSKIPPGHLAVMVGYAAHVSIGQTLPVYVQENKKVQTRVYTVMKSVGDANCASKEFNSAKCCVPDKGLGPLYAGQGIIVARKGELGVRPYTS
jgi:hypothetical protein